MREPRRPSRMWTCDAWSEWPVGYDKLELESGHPIGPKSMQRRLGPFRRSLVELNVIAHLGRYVFPRNLGYIGPGFGFVGHAGWALHPPDLAFIRTERLPAEPLWDRLSPVAPDLAIEVLTPVDEAERVAEEVHAYLAGGVALLWVADPQRRIVSVHAPRQPRRFLHDTDVLDGGNVLPDFRAEVAALFQ